MRIALITPFGNLHDAPDTGYYMVLAQHVLRNSDYATFYSKRGRLLRYQSSKRLYALGEQFTILDNGAAEGETPEWHDLCTAISIIDPDIVIAPDDLDNAANTFLLTRAFIESTAFQEVQNILGHEVPYMVVPHGVTWRDWQSNLDNLMRLQPQPSMIGVARKHTYLDSHGALRGRAGLVRYANRNYPDTPVHLLGLASTPLELHAIMHEQYGGEVVGVDTALPWVAGRHGMLFADHYGILGRPDHWHSDERVTLGDYSRTTAVSNCLWMLQEFSGFPWEMLRGMIDLKYTEPTEAAPE